MRIGLTVACVLLSWDVGTCKEEKPSRTDPRAQPDVQLAREVLREACEIALSQGDDQEFWSMDIPVKIGELQIRAGDLEGAIKSIQGADYAYGRNEAICRLAEKLARDGQRDRAFEVTLFLDWQESCSTNSETEKSSRRWPEHTLRRATKAKRRLGRGRLATAASSIRMT